MFLACAVQGGYINIGYHLKPSSTLQQSKIMEKPRLVIAVSGCTGTGKTKLGIELAKKYNGEVISADSMQIYDGLDIITNTVTKEESDGVKHHCISYISPEEQYTVVKYLEHTLPIIEQIFEQGKIPIIVGGTAYYVEALLWEFTLYDQSKSSCELNYDSLQILESDILNDYEKLQQLDSVHAQTLHPKDSRKISRSLEIFREYGTCHSTLLEKQHSESTDIRGNLRWDGALLFSIESDQQVLDKRLDFRVEKMLELGLCSELDMFSEKIESLDSGLLRQVIGFKEFESYILLKRSKNVNLASLQGALKEGIEKMKSVTRRYSRKQVRWIKNRLEDDKMCSNYVFNRLDSTYPEQWENVISKPVYIIVDQFLSGALQKTVSFTVRPQKTANRCQICDVTCIGDDSFSVHMKSRRHRRKKAYNLRKPIFEQHIAANKKKSLS